MKTRIAPRSSSPARGEEPGRPHGTGGQASERLHASDRLLAQRRRVEAAFGGAAQLQAGDEEELQRKVDPAQRAVAPEEEEPLQGRFEAAGPAVAQARATPNETGMPDALKSGIEALSGMDLSAVRVHANSERPAQLNALAYAQGNDIHLGPGQEAHLPHEAWHVVQQAQGRVQPTVQHATGVAINDDHGLEQEADVMGAKALGAAAQLTAAPEEEPVQGRFAPGQLRRDATRQKP